MLYEDDSPIYEIFWWSRSFLNGKLSNVNILYISATKSDTKTVITSMKSTVELGSEILSVLIVNIFLLVYAFFHMLKSIKHEKNE